MRTSLAALATAAAFAAQAQVCDVKYLVDVNTATNDVTTTTSLLYGVPVADLDDNSKKGMRVVNLLSKVQDKGGVYEVEVGEWRTCDGVTTKNAANSIMVKGVTLKDSAKVGDLAIKIAGEINDRYHKRADKGDKHGWDHAKAKKTQRDDLGNKKG